MNEWGVVGVIAALVTLGAALAGPMLRLNSTMTRLAVLVEELSDRLSALERANTREHEKLAGSIETSRGEVRGHETRITILEKGGRKNGGI